MIVLLDNGQDLDQCTAEIGCDVGQLLTPLTRRKLRDPSRPWAIDNGGFSGLNVSAFTALLSREQHRRDDCLFVAAPDIVGEAQRTNELFDLWGPRLEGWRIAFVAQDGQERLPIPWERIDAIFIGGSTTWKCGPHAAAIVKTAQLFEKWVHVGRVNTPGRFNYFEQIGADSCDGTGIARYTHMRRAIRDRKQQGDFFNAI